MEAWPFLPLAVASMESGPRCMASSAPVLRTGAKRGPLLFVDEIDRYFLGFAVAAADAGEIVLDDLVAALAEVFAQRLLDAGVDLLVGHLPFPRIRGELEKGAEEDDALHAHLQVGLRRDLAGDRNHVAVED